MHVRLFSDIAHVMTKADENKNVHVHCLLGLKHMTTYERVKPATATPVAELKMLCLFYFALESEQNGHNVGTVMVLEKLFYFSLLILVFYFNSQCQLILGSIHPAVH